MLPLIFLILIVAAFGVLAAYAPRNYATAKRLAIIFSGIVLVLSIVLVYYGLEVHGFLNSIESVSYISQFGIDLAFTAAPVQIILILLAAIVSLCATIVKSSKFENSKNLYPLIMLFELSAIGLFASGNLFIFYIFWDVGVIAAYFMISSFGQGQAKHAANAYLVYSIFASALLLFSIMMIYFYTPVHSFSISYITAHSYMIPQGIQAMIFALFFIAFMVKMPIFPFHSWISNAYASAPTQGSMVIAGVLSKFGAYGMLLLFSMLSVSSDFSKYAFAIGGISALSPNAISMLPL
ncbi:hypothetical protein M1373_03335 [Candidatus Marsarchaeota archaeon]|nr:hypothetical protein [Candidatus Marsarchaeota archaeon]